MTYSLLPLLLVSFGDFEGILTIAGATGTFIYGVWYVIKRFRQDSKDADILAEERIQKRINDAVDIERRRFEKSETDDEDRCQRLKEIADQWKEIASVREIKITDLTKKLALMQVELNKLEQKYNEVLEANSALVTRIVELEKRIK